MRSTWTRSPRIAVLRASPARRRPNSSRSSTRSNAIPWGRWSRRNCEDRSSPAVVTPAGKRPSATSPWVRRPGRCDDAPAPRGRGRELLLGGRPYRLGQSVAGTGGLVGPVGRADALCDGWHRHPRAPALSACAPRQADRRSRQCLGWTRGSRDRCRWRVRIGFRSRRCGSQPTWLPGERGHRLAAPLLDGGAGCPSRTPLLVRRRPDPPRPGQARWPTDRGQWAKRGSDPPGRAARGRMDALPLLSVTLRLVRATGHRYRR